MAATEDLRAWTRERYEDVKARAEARGYVVVTRWRPGLKRIEFAPIVLTADETPAEVPA